MKLLIDCVRHELAAGVVAVYVEGGIRVCHLSSNVTEEDIRPAVLNCTSYRYSIS